MENNNEVKRKILFSGVQPSGNLTLGNYIGALRNFKLLEDQYDCLYSIVDLHAITVRQDPTELRKRCLQLMSLFLALGLDPEKSLIYFQSHVSQHCELAWILNCFTYMGELQRMTQFKDKAAKHADNINAGLFDYPVLMAADILLYQADMVPVGQDQKQHLELTRDIAIRFNKIYGDTFTVPEGYIPKVGGRVMSLQDPTRKMSKSDENVNAWVAVLDKPEDIMRKFKRAVTDSEACVRYGEGKDGINNLMGIYSTMTGKSYEEIEREFDGKGYGDFKVAVAESVIECLRPVQERYQQLIQDKAYLEKCYTESAQVALKISQRTLDKAMKKIGFIKKAF